MSDGFCTCWLRENVRADSGFHIEKLTLERAREVLYDKAIQAEPPPLNEQRRRELWQEAGDLAPRYEGTSLASRCPIGEELEQTRVAAVRRLKKSRKAQNRIAEDE